MIYLDYSATTPVDERVLNSYIKVTNDFIGNANSLHNLGVKSKDLLMQATNQVAELLNVKRKELIFTSGSSESNATAIKGVAFKHEKRGKHIISSYLEHKDILETLDFLESRGFEVSYVKINENGMVDLNDLESLIREDTILVSICAVNSEVGFRQPLMAINQIIKKKNPRCIFHSDMTQALGKMKFSLSDVDMASFASHKIYAPKGIGLLYKKENIEIEPLIYGLTENTPFRGGTPALPLVAAFSKGLRLLYENLESNIKYVDELNKNLISFLYNYDIRVNSNENCVPHIVSISLINIKSETFLRALEKDGVCLSTNTACASGEESLILKTITNDKDIASTTIRISLSHLTTKEELEEFKSIFDRVYNSLLKRREF